MEANLKVARKECEMLKLKLQQFEENKRIIKRNLLCYQFAFILCLGIIVYVMATDKDIMYLWNRIR